MARTLGEGSGRGKTCHYRRASRRNAVLTGIYLYLYIYIYRYGYIDIDIDR